MFKCPMRANITEAFGTKYEEETLEQSFRIVKEQRFFKLYSLKLNCK